MVGDMAVLVTGATGYIGRRLVTHLLERGDEVRALVRPGDDPAPVAGARVTVGDVTDGEAVHEAARGARVVYHLAAKVGDWGEESEFWSINVDGTRSVLDAAERGECERVVMVSSIVVYGAQLRRGVCDEDQPCQRGVGPYGRSKVASEQLALSYHEAGRVPVAVVRPGNVYGPRAPLWVDTIVDLLRARRLYVVDNGNGDAALAYVDHVVDVITRAGESSAAAGRVYNEIDGAGISWRRYIEDLARCAAAPGPRGSIPYPVAYALAAGMESGYRALRRRQRPLITREAVRLMASRAPVPMGRAAAELGYRPSVPYGDAMERVAASLQGGTR